MRNRTSNTVLLVFSLSARSEAARKLVFGRRQKWAANLLFESLIDKTKEIAHQSGIDVAWMGEHEQVGSGFGERLGNAIQSLFESGYENVISIGNDSPELSSSTISTAVDRVNQQQLVLGPTLDGGAYLIGINRAHFEFDTFCALPWQQETLYLALRDMAEAKCCDAYRLCALDDIDDTASAIRFALRNPFSEVSTIIRHFLTINNASQEHYSQGSTQNRILSHPLRGPPTYIW